MRYAVAVDLGGTKLSAAVVNAEGRVVARKKTPLQGGSVTDVADQVATNVRAAVAESGVPLGEIACAGVIVPGICFAASGNVWAPNLWGHTEVPLRGSLEELLPMPVCLESDRAGYVLGEQWLGAARGLKDVVFLAVGTGIGAGIICGGQLLRGAADIAGAVGWFALTPEHCKRYQALGCWEAEAAGPALARRMGAPSAEAVVLAARRGDTLAQKAVQETGKLLGMGIANMVSLLNPEMVILGGGLMQAHELFLETIRSSVLQWAQPVAAQQVRIEPTQLGEDAGLFGAARIAFQQT